MRRYRDPRCGVMRFSSDLMLDAKGNGARYGFENAVPWLLLTSKTSPKMSGFQPATPPTIYAAIFAMPSSGLADVNHRYLRFPALPRSISSACLPVCLPDSFNWRVGRWQS